jgi:predicted transposase/invertase (TIGR01784 family)
LAKLEYTFKTDTLFKLLFVKHPGLLKHLVSELLGIRLESIGQFAVTNTEMPPEILGDKFCRLDINMKVDGQLVNLEIQVRNEGAYPERVLFNWARSYSSSLCKGQDYSLLPRTIVISIVDFDMFDSPAFHSEFRALETTRHTPLSDRMSLHFFELRKLPGVLAKDNMLVLWLSNSQFEKNSLWRRLIYLDYNLWHIKISVNLQINIFFFIIHNTHMLKRSIFFLFGRFLK